MQSLRATRRVLLRKLTGKMSKTKITWEQAVQKCMTDPDMAQLARSAYFMPPVEAGRAYHASAEFAAIKNMLPTTPGRALDLGAGNGILSFALACEGWEVTAVEPDPSALVGAEAIRAVAAETGAKISVIEAFGEAIPLEAAGFDLVVARQVLHHAADLPDFCSEMARLARPGATIITLRDHVISGPEQLEPFLAQHPLHHFYGGENAFTLMQYQQALTSAGLSIKSELKSFQSVINFDPLTSDEVLDRAASMAGPARPLVRLLFKMLPFSIVAQLMTVADRRPGRLVSFLCVLDDVND